MATPLRASIAVVVLLGWLPAVSQQKPSAPKTIPDSINYMWKMVESDFTSLAEAMPEEKWTFKPTQGAFAEVRTFTEQVEHRGVCDEAWANNVPWGDTARSTAILVDPLRLGQS